MVKNKCCFVRGRIRVLFGKFILFMSFVLRNITVFFCINGYLYLCGCIYVFKMNLKIK